METTVAVTLKRPSPFRAGVCTIFCTALVHSWSERQKISDEGFCFEKGEYFVTDDRIRGGSANANRNIASELW